MENTEQHSPLKLPEFKGYTVDVRLKEFRKVVVRKGFRTIKFDSDKGDRLLAAYIETLDWKSPTDRAVINTIWS
jgi:hypothetical protein